MKRGELRIATVNHGVYDDISWEVADESVMFSHIFRNHSAEPRSVCRLVLIRWNMEEDDDMAQTSLVEIIGKDGWDFDPSTVGPQDAYLDKAETGLPYSLIVEMDTACPVLAEQLSKPLGTLSDDLMDRLEELWSQPSKTDLVVGNAWPKTPDAPDQPNLRAKWKQEEVEDAFALSQPSLNRIYADDDDESDSIDNEVEV